MKKVIFHVDVNSAFLSWEACYRIHQSGGKAGFATAGECRGRRSRKKGHWINLANLFRQRNIIFRPGKRLFLQRKNVRTGSGAAQL